MKNSTNTTAHIYRSGPGGSHIGLFGRPAIFLAPEGDGGGGATGAGAPTGEVTTTTIAPGTPPAGSGEARFTQADMDRVVNDRLARDRRERGNAPQQPQQPAPRAASTTTEQVPSLADMQAEIATLRARQEFGDLIAEHNVPRERQNDLFDLYRVQRPQNPTEWASRLAPLFRGSVPSTTTNPTTNPQNGTQPIATPPPAAAPRAPLPHTAPIAANGAHPIYAVSPEQFSAMSPQQIRTQHEANLAAATSQQGAPPIRTPNRRG